MVRRPCCAKEGVTKGAWSSEEDDIMVEYIKTHGEGKWRDLPKRAGLKRCGKSCRLRWLNYLRPDIKRGNISDDEEDLIIRLHRLLGNRWSLIAGRLPGRTDNEIKNYWNSNLSKRVYPKKNSSSEENNNNPTATKKAKAKPSNNKVHSSSPPSVLETNSHVIIRTKAVRYTRAFLPTPQAPPRQEDEDDTDNDGGSSGDKICPCNATALLAPPSVAIDDSSAVFVGMDLEMQRLVAPEDNGVLDLIRFTDDVDHDDFGAEIGSLWCSDVMHKFWTESDVLD